MNECADYLNDPLKGTRRVVCAAILIRKNGKIVCGARHYDQVMHAQLQAFNAVEPIDKDGLTQGYIDQWDNFLTREDALIVALAANQRVKRCGGDEHRLYSENLY